MALKNYQTDYPEVKIPSGHWPIEPRETVEIDYIYERILYRNQALLNSDGDLCQVFRKKITGTRCINPNCPAYNNYQQAGSDDCPVCLGVGFVGGYDYIEEIKVRFAPSNERIDIKSDGTMRLVRPRTWTMPEPILRSHDIIINFSQPTILQEEMIVDKEMTRGVGSNPDFDVLETNITENRQIIRIYKISNTAISSKDYDEGIDYVLSNSGVLWKTDNRPEDGALYFVTYQISNIHYRRYDIHNVTPSRWRGKTLHQDLEVVELDVTHPHYRIGLHPFDMDYVYYPFQVSDWYDR